MEWDKTDLTTTLAEKYLDAEDLKDVFPAIDQVDLLDVEMYKDYVEQHWEQILAHIDVEDILEWLNEVENVEESEESLCAEEDETDGISEYLELIESFRSQDYAGLKGYPAKRIGS